MSFLSAETFSLVVDSTPLVSIDLVIRDAQGKVLIGKRLNKPAQGFWFVPGGRIKKNEPLADALARISTNELGITLNINSGSLLGVYEHFYQDSHESDNISTHYVALGYEFILPDINQLTPVDDQHETYQWLSNSELLASPDVHENTKAYVR